MKKSFVILLSCLILLFFGLAIACCDCYDCCNCNNCNNYGNCCYNGYYPPYAYGSKRIPLRYRGYYTTRAISVNVNRGPRIRTVTTYPSRSGGHMHHHGGHMHHHGGPGGMHHGHHGNRTSVSVHASI